jgi:hypothetical protein
MPTILAGLAITAGILLVAGYGRPSRVRWSQYLDFGTPFFQPEDPWKNVLLATIGALALIGPGVWSVDARPFGWKRISF